jgi:hypothetical protein
MLRTTAIPLLILAGLALTPTEVGASSITYFVVNYPTLQNGYTVEGQIITNGDTGTMLPGNNITSWDITILRGHIHVLTLNTTDSINFTQHFDATPTSISAASPSDGIEIIEPQPVHGIIWNHDISSVSYVGVLLDHAVWNSTLPSVSSPIASVPEPSSAVLASIGAIAALLAYGWSRHRREQRRQAAA